MFSTNTPPWPPHAPYYSGPKQGHPYRLLVFMLIGCAVAFPVVALGIAILLVAGGLHIATVTDGHDIVIVAAVVAVFALVVAMSIWYERSRDLSSRARVIGWALLVAAAVPGMVGAVYFGQEGAPQNLVRPTVNGRAEVGSVLAADTGRWSKYRGHLSFDYQWQVCARSCEDIFGATERTFVPTRTDLHRRIRFRVTATASRGNMYSSDWIPSVETDPVLNGTTTTTMVLGPSSAHAPQLYLEDRGPPAYVHDFLHLFGQKSLGSHGRFIVVSRPHGPRACSRTVVIGSKASTGDIEDAGQKQTLVVYGKTKLARVVCAQLKGLG